MNNQPIRAFLGAGVSGAGAITNLLIQAHPIFSIVCIGVSVVAGVYAILVSHATMKHRRLQAENDEIDRARNQADLCEGCLIGRIPARCPIPQPDRPPGCPLKSKGYDDD